jgi:hypothetical protein
VSEFGDGRPPSFDHAGSFTLDAGFMNTMLLPDLGRPRSPAAARIAAALAAGSAVLNANFMSTPQKISSVVKTYGKMTLSIIGYADATGSTAERAALASQRAEAVRLQMIGMGVPAGPISASGTLVNNYNDGRAAISLHPLVKS